MLQIDPYYAKAHYNLGNILLESQKYEEAISFYCHAITSEPNYIEAYTNCGLALTYINKNEEAIINYKKALKIDATYTLALNNLGNSLFNLKKYEEAIVYYNKVIALNPNHKEAYNNLASSYQEIGKLDEALLNYQLAIQKNSSYIEPLLNIIPILIQLNKTKDIQKFKRLNNNIMYEIYVAIGSFMDKSIIETKSSLKRLKQMLDTNALSLLNYNNQKFALAYFTFLDSMRLTRYAENRQHIYHIGDSHALSFAHQEVVIQNNNYAIKPLIIFGAKAWHLGNNQVNKYKAFFQNHINSLKDESFLMLSFGEIDCRMDEGIINFHLKSKETLHDIINKTVKDYIDYTESILAERKIKRLYMGVPAPVINKEETAQLRIEVVQLFNETLKKVTYAKGLNFLDIYKLTADHEGKSNLKYMCDDFHLSPLSLKHLQLDFI